MKSGNDSDFTQFLGAFDHEIDPGADFTAQLRKQLRVDPPAAQPIQRVLASPPKPQTTVAPPRRRPHPLMIAAAVLAVVAISLSSIWVLSDRAMPGQYAGPPEVTLPLSASVTPGADVELTSNAVPNTDGYYLAIGTDHVVLLSAVPPTDDGPSIVALDPYTGERLWELSDVRLYQADLEGDVLYGLQPGTSDTSQWEYGIQPTDLSAFDVATGEQLWTVTLPTYDATTYWGRLWVFDNEIMVVGSKSILAVEAQRGEILWNVALETLGIQPQPERAMSNLVVIGSNLAVLDETGTLTVFDIESGTKVSQTTVFEVNQPDFVSLAELHLTQHGLLAEMSYVRDGKQLTIISLLDGSLSGDILWTRDIGKGGYSDLAVSENGDIALSVYSYKSYPGILSIIGLRSYSMASLIWIDGKTGEDILTTEPVRISDYASMVVIVNSEYACYQADVFMCLDRNGTRYLTSEVQTSNNAAIYSDTQATLAQNTLWIHTDAGLRMIELP